MKKIMFICIAFFSLHGTLCAQFTLGLQGGIYSTLMVDFDKRAMARYVSNGISGTALKKFHTFTYEQYGYFLNEKDEFSVAPVAALTLGYEAKRFAFWTGVELIHNISENFIVTDPGSGAVASIVGYTYSLINVPLIMNLYFVSKPKVKAGFSFGAYIAFPLGDVAKSLPGLEGKPLIDIFSTAQQLRFVEEELKNDVSAGVRAGLALEFTLGQGAVTADLNYMRALTGGIQPLIISDSTVIEDSERKITILSGVRIAVGYKFRLGTKSDGTKSSTVSESGNYYMVVEDGTDSPYVEGPFSLSDMRNLYLDKKLTADTMLWKKGLTNWVKASTFSELNKFF